MTKLLKKEGSEKNENYSENRLIENVLNRRISRRQAIGRGAAIAIGAGVVVVGAGGAVAYLSRSAPAPTTITSTATTTATTTATSVATTTTTATTTPARITLRFNHWDFHPERIKLHLQKFGEEYNTDVEDIVTPFPAYQSTSQSKFLAGEKYDVNYALDSYQRKWLDSGWVRTVEGLSDSDTIKKSIYPGWLPSYTTTEGTLLSLPYFCASYTLYYNKRMADANGFTEPQTKEDVYNQCKKLKAQGMAAPYMAWWTSGMEEHLIMECLNEGIDVLDDKGTPLFEGNSKFTDLLNWYRNMYKDGLTGKDIVSSEDLGAQFSSLQNGNSYILVLHHYFYGLFNKSGQGPEVGNIVIPSKPVGPGGKTLGFGGVYLMGSKPTNVDAAWDFMKFLGWKSKLGEWTVRDAWVETDSLLSPYPEWFNRPFVKGTIETLDTKYQSAYQVINDYFSKYTVVPSYRAQLPWYADWRQFVITNLQAMIVGTTAVNDVPKLLADKARELKAGG